MSGRKRVSIIAVQFIVIVSLLSACRSQSADIEQDPSASPSAGESEEGEGEDESPPTLEVTRIIVETEVVEVTPLPEETPRPSKELVVCLGSEPESLYPYNKPRLDSSAGHILHGLYESMYTTLSYDYQARGIEKIPSLADGDASISPVVVNEGDRVFDAQGNVAVLREGIEVRTNEGEIVTFAGEPITMAQLQVDFSLKPLVWSDGTPVTADDSVYSFELAADPLTPVPKLTTERTAAYEATGERSLRWTGIPGFLDPEYFTNIWTPYPRHYWGDLMPSELLTASQANLNPLSHGPYVVSEWLPGEHITLTRNEHYYLAEEGLPRIDRIEFRFLASSSQLLAQLLAGDCDLITHFDLNFREAPRYLDAQESGQLVAHFQTGTVFEHIDFGINMVEEFALTQPDWFERASVRQAIAMCFNRQALVDDLLYGQAEVLNAYLPANHPLYPDDLAEWPYDPERANSLLNEAGIIDTDEDGLREDVVSGSPFKVTLLGVTGNDLGQQVANRFQADLAQCGMEVDIQMYNSDQYFADGPEGPLFGRKFDLAAFPWLVSIVPNCSLYLSSQIPAEANNWNRNFNNNTGFSDPAFDAACEAALMSLPGTQAYVDQHQEALRIWAEQLPVVPLFMRPIVAVTRPEIENLKLDPTQPSELWNIYELDVPAP